MRVWVKTGGIVFLVCVLGWLVFSRDVLHPSHEDMTVQHKREVPDSLAITEKISNYWHETNFTAKIIPESVFLLKNAVEVAHRTEKIMDFEIFVRQALPPRDVVPSNLSILFLHGMHYQSKNWEDLGTLQIMAALGHHAMAIDLPGYGKSGDSKLATNHGRFMSSVMRELSLDKPVIVSPSMSGTFSMPYLEKSPHSISGFLPVAPVASNSVPKSVLQTIQVPTLHIFGGKDNTGLAQQARTSLSVLPNYNEFEVKDAGHSPYLDQPDLFHALLCNFLELIRLQPKAKPSLSWRNWKTWKRQSLLSRI